MECACVTEVIVLVESKVSENGSASGAESVVHVREWWLASTSISNAIS